MKFILFLLALSFNIFLCIYPGLKSDSVEKSEEIKIETLKTRQAPERETFSYSDLLKNKASELSQK